MHARGLKTYLVCLATLAVATTFALAQSSSSQQANMAGEKQLLYVTTPGRGADTKLGGVGIVVFDAKKNYQFVKRIPTWNYPPDKPAEAVKGVAASPANGMIYISTTARLGAFDLVTEKKVWEEAYQGFCCDRMAISPDSKILYAPSYRDRNDWYIVDALTGKLIKRLETPAYNSHNTIYSRDGSRVFMAGSVTKDVYVADPKTHTLVQTIGPFSNSVRPFTVNGRGTYVFATVNDLLGFEVADVKTGKVIHRVEVAGYSWSRDKMPGHGCPSHGIAMSPDEKEIWVTDGTNSYLHVFDATVMPPKQVTSVKVRSQPYWITFGLDGKHVFPSSGDVIDAATKKVIGGLTDEQGRQVESEKLVEILFSNGKPVRTVDQFGIGQVQATSN